MKTNAGKVIKLDMTELDRRYLMAINQKNYWESVRKEMLKEMGHLVGDAAGAELPGGVYYMRVVKHRRAYTIPEMTISFLKRVGPKPDEFKGKKDEF